MELKEIIAILTRHDANFARKVLAFLIGLDRKQVKE